MKLCDIRADLRCHVCGRDAKRAKQVRLCFDESQSRSVVGDRIARHLFKHGPGTELSRLLKRFGIEPTPTCACRAKAAEMDAWGPDECSKPQRIEEVVAVMRAEAEARGLPFLDAAGRLLVRRAIANARRAAAS